MIKIRDSVIRARDNTATLSDRHAAFGELVCRFQDMAFAYAFAVLGDAYLAEDVAQEAFVAAWHSLGQLREPEAFPGWFKRIVRTQCNRLLRSKRLQFVEPESAINSACNAPRPDHSAENQQLVQKVLEAISHLPEKQRLVTMLFYVNGYSQDDIGQFLDLPISTVNKRLFTAREKLRDSMMGIVKEDLEQHRPSRNDKFSNLVNARLRPLTQADWLSITRLAFGRTPRDGPGKELWLTGRQNFVESKYVRRQYVAEDRKTKRIVAYGAVEQSIYLPRYKLFLIANSNWLRRGVGDLLLNQLFEDLHKVNAITVTCQEYNSNTEVIEVLRQRGFEEVSRQLDSRLSLSESSRISLSSALRIVEDAGITISTLTRERASDPKYAEKLHQFTVSLLEENADELSFKPPAYDAREARLWLEMPYLLPDGYFIAKHRDRYVGVIGVNLRDSLPRGVTLNPAGVLPGYRQRGIGTALMFHAIDYSQANRYAVIRTFNRPSETSLLRLNRKLGFKTEFEILTLEKCLKNVITIDNPRLFDDYAGTYRADGPNSQLNLQVRNENGRLTGECVGQKVELFPMSETEFFIKYFYGEVTFVRNAAGSVVELVFRKTNKNSMERITAVKVAEAQVNHRTKQ